MAIARAAAVAVALAALGLVLVSGDSSADPRTPPALPGLAPPFLGTALSGDGELTAAVDAYGDVVDLRPAPAGAALIDNPAARQAAGTVPAGTGIVPRVRVGGGPALPLWRGDSVRAALPAGDERGRDRGRFGEEARLTVRAAAVGDSLAVELIAALEPAGTGAAGDLGRTSATASSCAHAERAAVLDLLCRTGRALPPAVETDSRQRSGKRPGRQRRGRGPPLARAGAAARGRRAGLGAGDVPRSLLALHALTDRRTGAVAAGARDGWAYVWPRDAATAALAFAAAGYRGEARRVAGSCRRSTSAPAARFEGDGAPVPGRGAAGRRRRLDRRRGPRRGLPPSSPGRPTPGATGPTTRRAAPAGAAPPADGGRAG